MEPLAFQSAPLSSVAAPFENASAALPRNAVVHATTLSALFESEESGLLRFAIGLVGRRMVAEELVQETFLRLHQLWDQVENPRGWLYRSLRNLALNHLRDHSRETDLDEANIPGESALPSEMLGQMEATGMVKLHGLVGLAAKPDQVPLRLAPERRAKLLQALGSSGAAPAAVAAARSPVMRPHWARHSRSRKPWMWTAGLLLAEMGDVGRGIFTPFEVNTSRDRGYAAGNTLSGVRVDVPPLV